MPRTASSSSERKLCAFPSCTSAEVAALGGVICDEDFGQGAWPLCNSSSRSSKRCKAETRACQVAVTAGTFAKYAMSSEDEQGDAFVAAITKRVGQAADVVEELWRAITHIIIGGIVCPLLLSAVYMLLLRYFALTVIRVVTGALVVLILSAALLCYVRSGMELAGKSASDLVGELSSMTNRSELLQDDQFTQLAAASTDNRGLYSIAFWVLAVLGLSVAVLLCLWRKKIKRVAAMVKEASKAFSAMPGLFAFPYYTVVLQIGFCLAALLTAALISTTDPASFEAALNSTALSLMDAAGDAGVSGVSGGLGGVGVAGVELGSGEVGVVSTGASDGLVAAAGFVTHAKYESVVQLSLFFLIFYLLWLINFTRMGLWAAMSGAVCHWYFFIHDAKERGRRPIWRSVYMVGRYHIGSVAFAALIVAICQLVRLILSFIDKKTKGLQEKNLVLKLTMKSVQCCMYCFEKTVRFISEFGLVYAIPYQLRTRHSSTIPLHHC